jgi:hypothetical protein
MEILNFPTSFSPKKLEKSWMEYVASIMSIANSQEALQGILLINQTFG